MENIVLKIKAHSLADEARYIRKQEKHALKRARFHKNKQESSPADFHYGGYQSLREHRLMLRNQMRATHLARAFLAGTDYHVVEQKTHDDFNYKNNVLSFEVAKLIDNYELIPYGRRFGQYPRNGVNSFTLENVRKWMTKK